MTNFDIKSYMVLIVTTEDMDADVLRKVLAAARDGPFDINRTSTLADALQRLTEARIDIILVDLVLPDCQGIATFDRLFLAAPDIPIMILASEAEETVAIQAVHRGAQGYLSKGYFRHSLVPQALRNIIHRKSVEADLFIERERSRVILESIGEGVISTDLNNNLIYLNAVAERMTGWTKNEADGKPFSEVAVILDASTGVLIGDHLQTVIQENQPMRGAEGMSLRHRGGAEIAIDLSVAPVREQGGRLSGAVVILHDARAAQAATLAKVTYLSQHDPLTGLPNRMLLLERINQAITKAARQGSQLAVLFLDLDNFKHINDSLGHAVGDQLLQTVAQRLGACTRTRDTIGRQGGDEFIVVAPLECSADGAAQAAEKILACVAQPDCVNGHQLHVTTSIGISVYPQDGRDADTLLKNADTAMYHAKKTGRNNYQFFNIQMNVRAVERQMIEAQLRYALERNELALYFQPQVNLRNNAICGAEALLRWRHPKRGLMLPEHFISIAEDSGLIRAIGNWVLLEACRHAARWIDTSLEGGVAVNVSATEFRSFGFVERLRDILDETGVDPARLELELTESVLMRNAESSQAILREIKNLGVKLVVDDFGTGYSSLSYLKQFPIDVLKIDQSFVRDVLPDSNNGIIVKAVVGMGKNLRLQVVAEGVETEAQCEFLRAVHCDAGQGFYFSPPLPSEQFSRLLETGIANSVSVRPPPSCASSKFVR